MGLISKIKDWLGWSKPVNVGGSPPPPTPSVPMPTLEIFAQPGHGKSSYLWSVLYMLRKMNLVWPNYLCSPRDETTEEALDGIHENFLAAHLPGRGPEANQRRYHLDLENMVRWGTRDLSVWDWPDPVFAGSLNGNRPEKTNWISPALWLVSLQDLGQVRAETLDMRFDDLIRTRTRQGFPVYSRPFRLMVVLTKGDAIPNLPLRLRQYLKEDPLWQAVRSEVSLLSPPPSAPAIHRPLDEDEMRVYVGTMVGIHEEIRDWLESTLVGHMLIRRAAANQVDLRFAIVSATGSGLVEGQSLRLPWTPRRVLDPLFWVLEPGSTPRDRI
ncbi:MAG TPA: hypothetical protein VF789_14590 [Thermoanaerobaculia bacterium]